MSFSFQVKSELSRTVSPKACCQRSELAAILKTCGVLEIRSGSILLSVTTENPAVARRTFKLFKGMPRTSISVLMADKQKLGKGKYYQVKAEIPPQDRELLLQLGIFDEDGRIVYGVSPELIKNRCCRRAYLRGAFLGRGSVNKPEGNYHLEIVCPHAEVASALVRLMARENIKARYAERKQAHVVYVKDSEGIVDLLRLMGASNALLSFENVRIVKSVRNQVNRVVNCETANLEKTVDAAMRQKKTIEALVASVGLENIPQNWRETAIMRLKYPDCSLQELGSLMNPPLSKSAVAYRLRRLEEMAARLHYTPGQEQES